MILFAIESSAKCCSAAVTDDNTLLGEIFINNSLTHSHTLMSGAESLLRTIGISAKEIDVFAAARGPGSYTGLRIGIAAIKGMAYGLGKPCVGVSALEAMAYGVSFRDGSVCCVMDARNQRVYCAFFNIKDGIVSRITPDQALPIDDVLDTVEKNGNPIWITGDGATLPKFQEFYALSDLAVPAPEQLRLQRASYVALPARMRWKKGESQTASELLPDYLKENYIR